MKVLIEDWLRFGRRSPLLATLLLVLFARMAFLFGGGLSLDDLKYFSGVPPKELLLSQGRFGWMLLDRCLFYFGVAGPYWYVHASVLGCFALAWSGLVFARVALREGIGSSSATTVVVAVLFCVHPFQAEILTFREAFPFYSCAVLLGALGLRRLLDGIGARSWLFGAILVLAGLSVNQLVLNLVAVALVFRCINTLVQRGAVFDAALMRAGGGISVAVVCFLVAMSFLVSHYGVSVEGRAQVLDMANLGPRGLQVMTLASELLHFQFFVPAPWLSLLVFVLVLAGLLRCLFAASSTRAAVMMLGWIFLLPIAAIGVVAAGAVFWPAPRTLVGFSLVTSVLIATALRGMPAAGRWAGVAIIAFVYGCFVVIGDAVALDQARVNRRDQLVAALIDDRVGGLGIDRVAFVGEWRHGVNVRTRIGDMSLSAFAVDWSREAALTEYTGRRWKVISSADRSDWRTRCVALQPWPSNDSVFIDSGIAVICL